MKWKQPKFPSTNKWIHKVQYIYIMGYYSAIKRNEILIHATRWMNLENMKQKKPVIEDQILCDSIYMKCPEYAKVQRHKVDEWVVGWRD